MTDLSEVAASVAKALGLVRTNFSGQQLWEPSNLRISDRVGLAVDGKNLTDPYWIWRCVEWLRAQGWAVTFEAEGWGEHFAQEAGKAGEILVSCPAAEFPARAIHELMKGQP